MRRPVSRCKWLDKLIGLNPSMPDASLKVFQVRFSKEKICLYFNNIIYLSWSRVLRSSRVLRVTRCLACCHLLFLSQTAKVKAVIHPKDALSPSSSHTLTKLPLAAQAESRSWMFMVQGPGEENQNQTRTRERQERNWRWEEKKDITHWDDGTFPSIGDSNWCHNSRKTDWHQDVKGQISTEECGNPELSFKFPNFNRAACWT